MTDWNKVEESKDAEQVPPGCYVVQIMSAKDDPKKEYNVFTWDIAEGEHAGNFACGAPDWMHSLYRSYKDSALGMYKAWFLRVEESNPGWKFNGDEHDAQQFVGKQVGFILREEEYEKNNGDIGTRISVGKIVAAQDVRNGEAKPMPLKKLKTSGNASAASSGDDVPYDDQDVPF